MVGTGTVANISTNITDKSGNSTTLVKTDLGTLNLSVANSYTGGGLSLWAGYSKLRLTKV
ncbi:hypothetical protein [Bombella pollinis]|uniref:Uncharacterized protein n=1 Tax=Bombella pollinis TaxID=2967337 RepID=A0ABT3WPG9_9PROT|nr:hypothetical protein [Bombella pollinis]MCX5619543.1 hypothetical protein [Bombella pollinis]